jgi:transcriptional regulator with XRE-family HTH domain
MEKLRAFVKKIMNEQGLSEWQIEKRSESRITDSYVKDIISGKAKSIGVDKLNALALGLGVDSVTLFKLASREDPRYASHSWPTHGVAEATDPWPSHELAGAIDKIVHSPELTEIVKKLLVAKPAKLKALARELEKS